MSSISKPGNRRIPINLRGVRSGYVYVAQSSDNLDICKVGHTTRPPHVRMKELGKTTWLAPIRVNSARFFWDAASTERQIHDRLSAWRCAGTEEWFDVPAFQVANLIANWVDPVGTSVSKYSRKTISDDQEWLNQRLEWALDQLSGVEARDRKEGWRDIERLSTLGYAPATWLVAERLLLEDAPAEHVLWVLDAANRQGHQGASLRRDWVASLTKCDPTRRVWKEKARQFMETKPDPSVWSPEDRQTMEGELNLWAKRPALEWSNDLKNLFDRQKTTPTP